MLTLPCDSPVLSYHPSHPTASAEVGFENSADARILREVIREGNIHFPKPYQSF